MTSSFTLNDIKKDLERSHAAIKETREKATIAQRMIDSLREQGDSFKDQLGYEGKISELDETEAHLHRALAEAELTYTIDVAALEMLRDSMIADVAEEEHTVQLEQETLSGNNDSGGDLSSIS